MRTGAHIGELARAAGVSVQTVRYYERLGLLPRAPRSPAGYRIYASDSLVRIHFVRQAQAVGLSLEEILEVLRIRDSGKAPCECVRGKLVSKLEEIERQLAHLTRFRRQLQRMLKQARKLPRLTHSASSLCPIIEATAAESDHER
jgi:DNA-binding transcriptional MerR regulator